MGERWAGIAVLSDRITIIDALVEAKDPIVIEADLTWKLQAGERPDAYVVMHRQISDFISERGIQRVMIKASAVSQAGGGKTHLEAAELRGIVICAAASVTEVTMLAKNTMSKTFGKRKVDEYLKDDEFWQENIEGNLFVEGVEKLLFSC